MQFARRLLPLLLSLVCCGPSMATPPAARFVVEVPGPDAQQPLYAGGHDLYEGSGRLVRLHGFNWSGFNTGGTMVDGLWGGPGLVNDFATVVLRQRLLGFNAVRLPFSFADLQSLPPKPLVQNCVMPTDAEVARSVLAPGHSLPAFLDGLPHPPHRIAGQCNGYVPTSSTWDRFKWVVSFYARNGFYVVIDNHLRDDRSALDHPVGWAKSWARLVRELRADKDVRKKLLVDLLNEPDQMGLRWESQSGLPSLSDLYLRAMDAIEDASPGALYMVQGTGQGAMGASWGDGFATDNDIIGRLGLSNPRPFFARLMRKRYARHVILAPHLYGPAVSGHKDAVHGQALVDRLSRSFGNLTQHGFCSDSTGAGSVCQTFPVIVGEMGSRMEDAAEVQSIEETVQYLRSEGDGNDQKHSPIRNVFWASWNANAGETGGLVGDDWLTVQWPKLKVLEQLGLKSRL